MFVLDWLMLSIEDVLTSMPSECRTNPNIRKGKIHGRAEFLG